MHEAPIQPGGAHRVEALRGEQRVEDALVVAPPQLLGQPQCRRRPPARRWERRDRGPAGGGRRAWWLAEYRPPIAEGDRGVGARQEDDARVEDGAARVAGRVAAQVRRLPPAALVLVRRNVDAVRGGRQARTCRDERLRRCSGEVGAGRGSSSEIARRRSRELQRDRAARLQLVRGVAEPHDV